MAASKKTRLRMGWSGDQFLLAGIRFDDNGAWDENGKAISFTESEAADLVALAAQNDVTLAEIQEPDAAPSGTASGQEG